MVAAIAPLMKTPKPQEVRIDVDETAKEMAKKMLKRIPKGTKFYKVVTNNDVKRISWGVNVHSAIKRANTMYKSKHFPALDLKGNPVQYTYDEALEQLERELSVISSKINN